MLHGSRARGDAHAASDWDFAYRASAGLDELGLRAALVMALDSDAVDLADLDRSSGVRAAGFRNLVAHAYASIDLARVHEAARHGPADLRAFVARVRDLASGGGRAPAG